MIKIKNGHRYSDKEFGGYEWRAKLVAENEEGEQMINTDVYTDNKNKLEVEHLLLNLAHKKGLITSRPLTGIIHWATEEQDEAIRIFLDKLDF